MEYRLMLTHLSEAEMGRLLNMEDEYAREHLKTIRWRCNQDFL